VTITKIFKVFYVPCSESKTMSNMAKVSGDNLTFKKVKIDPKALKEIEQKLNVEKHKKLRSDLTDVQAKKLDETDKIITKVETNLIDNENSNLHIIKNLSVDLKEILPLNNMYSGTDLQGIKDTMKALHELKFNNSVMLKFTNKVLVFLFGKNADTIQSQNPLYFRALRDTTPSIVLNLMHDVIIIDKDNNCFNSPIGRRPKMINFNFKKLYRFIKKPKNVSSDISAKDYFNSKFNKDGNDYGYISFELFNDISKFILMSIEKADKDVPLLKLLNAVNTYIDAGNNYFAETQVSEQITATKECIYNLLEVATNSDEYDVLLNTLIHMTDKETFKDFKDYVKSFGSKSVKINMYQAVKFDGTKVKYLQADTSEQLVKQLKNV